MNNSINTPYSFVVGMVQDAGNIVVIAQIDELAEMGEPDSTVMRWNRAGNKWGAFEIEWSATRVCAISGNIIQVLATGPLGRVAIHDDSGLREEDIDGSDNGTLIHGDIRDMKYIGEHYYATGMGRQVYRREDEKKWVHIDKGVLQTPSTTEVAGFNSLDGLKEDDIYTVGFYGEIWHYYRQRWQKIESPTNVILNRVKVVRDDLVYICGQQGTLLSGSSNEWKILENEITQDQIWDIEWFNNTLYLSTDTSLYRLLSDGSLEQIDMKLGYGATCGSVHAKDGVLVSVGRKHIVWTEDGQTWNDITPK